MHWGRRNELNGQAPARYSPWRPSLFSLSNAYLQVGPAAITAAPHSPIIAAVVPNIAQQIMGTPGPDGPLRFEFDVGTVFSA